MAATLLSYEWKKDDKWAGEGDIENMKVAFITNFHLFRVGFGLGLNRFMRTLKDPEPKDWIVPMTQKSREQEQKISSKTVGKAVSDSVEAMTGALFLSNSIDEGEMTGLYRAIKWLNDIDCLPLEKADVLSKIRSFTHSTFGLDQHPLRDY